MRNLELFSTASIDHLLWSSGEQATLLSSPALSILTDFDHSQPMVIDVDTSIPNTVDIMEKTHTYMRLVVDKNNNFIGIISKKELLHRRLIKRGTQLGCNFTELTVQDLMVPRDKLLALDYQQMKTAVVSDVVRVLQEKGLHHMLVIDQDKHHIRGLISANDVARKLNIRIDIHQPPSFQHIFKVSSHIA
ncbi:CBS domain protein [Sinobacterium caligoides]|uniref:CBS domain protein n=1 Tax=Sinobacterium caligoides TaxID=933926 RepID=A0A3N2DXQ7_9GAMM|nr:CBS domain-containing protein [Sinobacterium caligoides]ROS04611.1 CBS domain protein [Sinobacterium caligoides]